MYSSWSCSNVIKYAGSEIKKLEVELWNLKVKGIDVLGYNQRFQELTLLCVRMFPEESDKIEKYVGGLPDMIHECGSSLRHSVGERRRSCLEPPSIEQQVQAAPQWAMYCKVRVKARRWPMTRDCRNPAAARNQRTLTCYECRNPGHYRSDCGAKETRNHGTPGGWNDSDRYASNMTAQGSRNGLDQEVAGFNLKGDGGEGGEAMVLMVTEVARGASGVVDQVGVIASDVCNSSMFHIIVVLWTVFISFKVGLHYLLAKVVPVGMYRDLSPRTSGPLQDPTTATITTITITNDEGMQRVRTLRETISPE
ncbi:reverse transcriptase domain-containing protein [Tanacetum coccineum]